ncbi:hypothetical protein [Chitinophaga sp. 212800010-3]|uniref:hypothetical protein n=1 Tax=unclassified Chitinophaga TaxID=2619133 RepID=UPI002DE5C58F|nr:hypothetical protein [Chitinophaga sp. 212800010-3]
MNFKAALQYVPIGVLAVALAYSIYTVSTTNIILVDKFYPGIFLVLISLIITRLKPRAGRWFTLFTLFVGMLNLVTFTPTMEVYFLRCGLNGKGIEFEIQSFSLLVFILFVVINIKSITGRLQKRLDKVQE